MVKRIRDILSMVKLQNKTIIYVLLIICWRYQSYDEKLKKIKEFVSDQKTLEIFIQPC